MAPPQGVNLSSVSLLYISLFCLNSVLYMRFCEWSAQGCSISHSAVTGLRAEIWKSGVKHKRAYSDAWWPLCGMPQSWSPIVWLPNLFQCSLRGWNDCLACINMHNQSHCTQTGQWALTWPTFASYINAQKLAQTGICTCLVSWHLLDITAYKCHFSGTADENWPLTNFMLLIDEKQSSKINVKIQYVVKKNKR